MTGINIPTIDELAKRIRKSFNAELPNSDAFLYPNFLYVASKVMAIMSHSIYRFCQKIYRQVHVTTCNASELELHGAELGISKNPATFTKGQIRIISNAGQSITQGEIFIRSDGLRYTADQAFTTTGDDLIDVTAENTGSSYNTVADTPLSLAVTNNDITQIEVSSDGLGGGTDIETDEAYRKRLLENKRSFKIFGTRSFIRDILKQEVPGVTRVFFDKIIKGKYDVYFMMDDTYNNGIPLNADIQNVQNVLDSDDYAHQGMDVTAKAPTLQSLDVVVTLLHTASPEQLENIKKEITDVIVEEGSLSTTSAPFIFAKENIDLAVGRGLGDANYNVITPNTNVSVNSGSILAVGTIQINNG